MQLPTRHQLHLHCCHILTTEWTRKQALDKALASMELNLWAAALTLRFAYWVDINIVLISWHLIVTSVSPWESYTDIYFYIWLQPLENLVADCVLLTLGSSAYHHHHHGQNKGWTLTLSKKCWLGTLLSAGLKDNRFKQETELHGVEFPANRRGEKNL